MRFLTYLALWFLLAGCTDVPHALGTTATEVARLQNGRITEASGLAYSGVEPGLLWIVNDGGSPPFLHAVGTDGSDRGSILLANAGNVDWEGLASFKTDGQSWLLVADIGDNAAKRVFVSLYLLEEPTLPAANPVYARQIRFVFPDGPRDAEAVAVDAEHNRALILTKRTIPAELYAVPLDSAADGVLVATQLGTVDAIPEPSREDRDRAPADNDWHWQPTGMDISADGRSMVILAYRAIYRFERLAGTDWTVALKEDAAVQTLGGIRNAEAVVFDAAEPGIFVTVERRHAPLYRFDNPQ